MSEQKPETSTQSGKAYRVEVRAKHRPIQIGDTWIGNEWTRLPTVQSIGIGTAFASTADRLTYSHDYYGAVALAASALSAFPGERLETRIVEYQREITYKMLRGDELTLPGEIDRMFAIRREREQELSREDTR